MVVARAINVFPAQVAAVINWHETLSGEYRIVLESGGPYDALPEEAVLAEGISGEEEMVVAETLAASFKRELGISARVTLVPFASLPRTEGKTRRVVRREG